MRALLAIALLSACAPEIVQGAYLCGPEQSCPEGQACNGADNVCVLPGGVKPFECGDKITEVEPNNGASAAQTIANLACVSPLIQIKGCTPATDAEDWYAFDVPVGCGATVATVRIDFPLAFEQLSIELAGKTGSQADCGGTAPPDDGSDTVCLSTPVTAGQRYTLRVARSGVGDCDGECAFNRYSLSLQLGTP
ncbi:MAG: hypothetical protein JNL83_06965 [Myxococcales bacterium]|nr:hypothetical protein [Myxococcales bacterium]